MDLFHMLLMILVLFISYQLIVRFLSKVLRRRVQVIDPAIFSKVLDSRFRRALQPPENVVIRSGVREGMIALDLGCGAGTFTVPLARFVGREGKVLAMDINPAFLEELKRKLDSPQHSDVRNTIDVILASAHDLPLADGSVDICLMVTVLQEIPDRVRALREVFRVLKPGGILAVTEFLIDPDYALKSTTVRLRRDRFLVEDIAGSFWDYTVKFRKPDHTRHGVEERKVIKPRTGNHKRYVHAIK